MLTLHDLINAANHSYTAIVDATKNMFSGIGSSLRGFFTKDKPRDFSIESSLQGISSSTTYKAMVIKLASDIKVEEMQYGFMVGNTIDFEPKSTYYLQAGEIQNRYSVFSIRVKNFVFLPSYDSNGQPAQFRLG